MPLLRHGKNHNVAALGIAPESDLLVAFDDLDLPFGRLRLRAAGGCGGHRGMESIADVLGSDRFARLRFGIVRGAAGVALLPLLLLSGLLPWLVLMAVVSYLRDRRRGIEHAS